MRFIFTLISISLSVVALFAQGLEVKTMNRTLDPMTVDIQRKDRNGNVCAIVKVQLPIAGVKFEGNVIDSKFDGSEYWVYMSDGSKMLQIKCPNQKPIMIEFKNYPDIGEVHSKGIYTLRIDMERPAAGDENTVLRQQYDELAYNAQESFNNKKFKEAREFYDKAITPYYLPYFNPQNFEWINLCDTIIVAQKNHKAITPELAAAFKGLSSSAPLSPLSEDVWVVDYGRGDVKLIHIDGTVIDMAETFVRPNYEFSEGLLSVNMNGANCYIDKNAKAILNYRSSNYNELFKDVNLYFNQFKNHYAKVFNTKNGKVGLINKYGVTVLPMTNKYKNLVVLKESIFLWDDKNIYKWNIPNKNSPVLDIKNIYSYIPYQKYKGKNYKEAYVMEINEDYIRVVLIDKEDMRYHKIIPFNGKYEFLLPAERVFQLDDHTLLLQKGYKNNYTYSIFELAGIYIAEDLSAEEIIDIDPRWAPLVSNDYKDWPKYYEPAQEFEIIKNEFGMGGFWGLKDRFGTTTFDYQ